LFADAAAAVVLRPADHGTTVVDVGARTDHATTDHMTWDITDLGFRMGLSPQVPTVLGRHVRPMVEDLLGRHGLTVDDVGSWAVHPGGPRILDTVERELALPPHALDVSRAVLRDRGNCSSATVLVILDELRKAGALDSGGPTVVMAFGPGLTLYVALLSVRPRSG
jgi:predicted naringenin-chalcone synthase